MKPVPLLLLLLLLLLLFADVAAGTGGVGEYRFGMSKDEVRAVRACAPYKEVGITGGLECPGFRFAERPMNVSFVFGPAGLSKIQLWFYQGPKREKAEEATDGLIAFLEKEFGDAEEPTAEAALRMREELFRMVDARASAPNRVGKVQFGPRRGPPDAVVFASIFRDLRFGYYVFLYYTPPPESASAP